MTGRATMKALFMAGATLLASGTAFAQEAAPGDTPAGDDEIIVTAERRDTTVQRAPLTLQVLGGDALQARQITSLAQIASLTPGLKVDNNAGRGYTYIRGIGTDAVGIGVDPSVATYIDGVYSPRGNSIFAGLWDLDHVEVLKGPQGTLYGRNATGGAILTLSKQPELGEFTGYGLVSYGNFNRMRGEAAINVPLGEKVAIRISGTYQDDDGYINNLFLDRKEADQTIKGVRANLLFAPSEDIKITLSGYMMRVSGSRGATFKLDTTRPSPTLIANPTITVPSGRYDVNYNAPNLATLRMDGGSLTIAGEHGPVAFKSTTGYSYTASNRQLDFDATQVLFNETTNGLETSKAFTQSIQFNNAEDGAFNWMVGADYLHESLTADIRSRFPTSTRLLQANNKVDALSFFADASYEIADGLRLSAGARYSAETKNFFSQRQAKGNWNEWTPRFGLQYQATNDILFYASATKGFKSGGFNSSAVQPPFGPEKIWSYEAGVKTSWLDNRVIANLSAFYYDYRDLQATQIDPNNGAIPITTNAGKATVKGIDGELSFKLSPAFRIGGNFTYLDSAFGD